MEKVNTGQCGVFNKADASDSYFIFDPKCNYIIREPCDQKRYPYHPHVQLLESNYLSKLQHQHPSVNQCSYCGS